MIITKDILDTYTKSIASLDSVQQKKMVKAFLDGNELENGLELKIVGDENIDEKGLEQMVEKAVSKAIKVKAIQNIDEVEVVTPEEEILSDSKFGFSCIAEQAIAIHRKQINNISDPRLEVMAKAKAKPEIVTKSKKICKSLELHAKAAPSSFASELTGADGDYLVAPDFRDEIWIAVHNKEGIWGQINPMKTSKLNVFMPADENKPWDTTGIQVNFIAQGAAQTPSKIAVQGREIKLGTLRALVAVGNELMEDTPLLQNYLAVKTPEKINYVLDEAVFRGAGGGGIPLGFLNSNNASLITVTSTTSKANKYALVDLANMVERFYSMNEDLSAATWYMSRSLWSNIVNLSTATAGFPIGLSSMNIDGKIIPTILGIPVRTSVHCSQDGTAGDIVLANTKEGYLGFEHVSGIQSGVSVHLYWDANASAFRYLWRVGGEPALKSVITLPNDTTNTLGHFVVLGTRT